MKQVEKNYGDKIRIVWRHNPLGMHPDAPLASEAAQEIYKEKGKDAFWKFHDSLFDKQGTPDGLKRAALENYAEPLGIDMPRFKKALDTNANKPFVDADVASAGKAGISGAPAFVIAASRRARSTATTSAAPRPTASSRRSSRRRSRKRSSAPRAASLLLPSPAPVRPGPGPPPPHPRPR